MRCCPARSSASARLDLRNNTSFRLSSVVHYSVVKVQRCCESLRLKRCQTVGPQEASTHQHRVGCWYVRFGVQQLRLNHGVRESQATPNRPAVQLIQSKSNLDNHRYTGKSVSSLDLALGAAFLPAIFNEFPTKHRQISVLWRIRIIRAGLSNTVGTFFGYI